MKIVYLMLASIANLALGVYGIFPAMMSPMLFDAPGSTRSVALWFAFCAMLVFPIVAIAAAIAPWLFYRKGRVRAAVVSSAAALVWLALLGSVIFVALPNS